MEDRQASQEFNVIVRKLDIRHIIELRQIQSIGLKSRESSILWNQPLQIAIVQAIEQHLLVVPSERDNLRIIFHQSQNQIYDPSRVRPSIDQAPEKHYLAVLWIPRNVL